MLLLLKTKILFIVWNVIEIRDYINVLTRLIISFLALVSAVTQNITNFLKNTPWKVTTSVMNSFVEDKI